MVLVCENARWGKRGGGGCDSDIIESGVVIALLGVTIGGLLPLNVLKSQ